jgi:hypothetical protein
MLVWKKIILVNKQKYNKYILIKFIIIFIKKKINKYLFYSFNQLINHKK